MDIINLTAGEIAAAISTKKISSKEATAAFLKRIQETDGTVKSFLSVNAEALKDAEKRDLELAAGKSGPLYGVPVAIKDNMCLKGSKTTCASKILENFTAPYDATVIKKLKAQGMVFLGKCNMDEFAMGSSTENSAFQTTRNPWDTSRIPGGSSGGSAAAVASKQAPLSLGSDTGGSIRQPAACCGIVGLKPTYGRVSRYGLVAFASSLDQIGPFAGNTEDCALLMNAISGYDPLDSTSINKDSADHTKGLKDGIKGMRIGLPSEYFEKDPSAEGVKAVLEAAKVFEQLGAKVEKVSLPHTDYCLAVYYIIATAEASSNLARYDGVHYGFRDKAAKNLRDMYNKTRAQGFGSEVKRRIMLGTYVLSAGYYDAYYLKAQKVRTLISKDFENVFKNFDLILTPTAPTPAFKIGEKVSDPIQMYLSDIFTISVNIAGVPGVSVPCGFSSGGLPLGLQLIGRPFEEAAMLQAAYSYEQATSWHKKAAPVK